MRPWGWGDLEGGLPGSLQVLECQPLPRLPPASGSERTLAGLTRAPSLPHATLDRLLEAQAHVGLPSVWLTSGVGKGLSQPSWGSRSGRLFSPGTGGSQNLQSLDSTSLPSPPNSCLFSAFFISTSAPPASRGFPGWRPCVKDTTSLMEQNPDSLRLGSERRLPGGQARFPQGADCALISFPPVSHFDGC